MDRKKITADDLIKYKKILELTDAHLTDYQPGADIRIMRRYKYRDVIIPSTLISGYEIPKPRKVKGGNVLMVTVSRFYLDQSIQTAFSTLRILGMALRKKKEKKLDVIRAWLEKQDTHALQRPMRKRFARKAYTENKVMNMWECDLVDVQDPGKFNDNYKHVLSVIYVFSNFLHLVSLRSKTGTAVASAFMSIFDYSSLRRRPVWGEQIRAKNSEINISKRC